MVPTSLDKKLKTFNCNVTKGIFPLKFVNEHTLKYEGPKPEI
jgi:hypothetical protein